jgi:hypothetical protein
VHEKILVQTESARVLPRLLTTALRTELGTTLVIGVETRHCRDGLLPLPVAPLQDDQTGFCHLPESVGSRRKRSCSASFDYCIRWQSRRRIERCWRSGSKRTRKPCPAPSSCIVPAEGRCSHGNPRNSDNTTGSPTVNQKAERTRSE